MKIGRTVFKSIEETKYLTTENTYRYRAICRVLYHNYQRMRYWLYKEDILEELKENEEFLDYNVEMLKSDLDTLVQWRNLIAVADTTKVNSIEEFKNREFRYHLSEVAIEVERFLIDLEHMKIENTATLEASLVERFKHLLQDYKEFVYKEEKETYDWWKELNTAFKDLNINYQDYISKFYSPKNEELMQTTSFLLFKESFIKYLRQFVKNIQTNTFEIREVFNRMTEDEIEEIIDKAYRYEKSIEAIGLLIDGDEYINLNLGRMESIKEWFIGSYGREALVDQLISNTNEVIRRITRYALQISDKKNNNANRKEEYRNLARIFEGLEDIKECHKLSSEVFGSFNIIKILAAEERETESINSSIYDESPKEYIITPRVRTYREKIIKNLINDKTQRKEKKLELLLKKRKSEEERIKGLLKNDVIDFKELPEIESNDRVLLLKLLTKGMSNKNKWKKSDFGMEYTIDFTNKGENIILQCSDGDLRMPHYKLIFRKGE